LAVLTQNNQLVEAQRLQQRTSVDLEMIQELGYCTGIENYSRFLSEENRGSHRPHFLIIYRLMRFWSSDESHNAVPQIGAMFKRRSIAQGNTCPIWFPAAFGAG
jgi:excinuclease ABC subunit B